MKEKIHFETIINAPAKKVWDTMIHPDTYKEWTSIFEPTSYYEGSWDKGSKIKFLSTSSANKGGMFSEIFDSIPYEFISIKHLGMIKNGEEDTTSEESKKWFPAFENYTFVEEGEKTLLKIDMEVDVEYKKMLEDLWPKALEKLKEICER